MNHVPVEVPTPSEPDAEEVLRSPAKRVVALALTALLLLGAAWAASVATRRALVASEDQSWRVCEGVEGSTPEWENFYAVTLPTWFLSTQSPGPREESARREVLATLPAELVPVFEELATVRSARPMREALPREFELVDAWNDFNREQGIPWRLRLPMNPQVRAASLFALSYCIQAEATAESGDEEPVPVLFAARADTLSVVEGYAGHAQFTDREAFLIVDRLSTFAADRLWPFLASADAWAAGPDDAIESAWRAPVAAEITAQLSQDTLEVLTVSADDRLTLMRFYDGLQERAACGATFAIRAVPMRGFERSDTNAWRAFAAPSGTASCPNFTFEELDEVAAASERLRSVRGLRPAVQELAALHARHVAYHEVRHVLDRPERPCTTCGLDRLAEQELSAYLATFSAGPTPYAAAYEGCQLLQGRSGQHGRALRFALRRLLPNGCNQPPPSDFAATAAALEIELFGDSTEVEWTEPMPNTVRSAAF